MITITANTDIDDYGIKPEDIPYIVMCEDHWEWTPGDNLKNALNLSDNPEGWCVECDSVARAS
jgi:hypothetical protein